MARYRVAFDGEWQGNFEDQDDPLGWAKDVSETGRLTWVVKRRWFGSRLVAVFPEDRSEEGEILWEARMIGSRLGTGG